MATTQAPVQLHRGIVKQVLTGDSIVVRGQPKGGPPPERTICLSNVVAPKLARRANPNVEASVETKDEPFAWEAREFLRKKLIGKEVTFTVEYKVPGSDREYGVVYLLGKGNMQENITESMVSEGLVEVRRLGIKPSDDQTKLIDLEELTKAAGKGKWSQDPDIANRVRDISWNLENPRHFVDSHHNKPVQAVIEYVRDGCTMRAFLLPSFQYVTVMLSGVKCPMFKMEDNKQVMEEYAQEAKFFVESRLLQRDVNVILEGVSNQNLLGTVLHPNGNITELLLKEGFARCVDWSMGVVTQGAEKLRAAEKTAKEKRLRIWKDYVPSNTLANIAEKEFSAKVMEVVNGDALVVKTASGESKKIFLSSIRPPRPQDVVSADGETKRPAGRVRPLYDIPYMFEAREFLRKKLIGKKVNVLIDYIQPPSDAFPEKNCCTVTIGSINVAEALISKGLATVIRYRQDDDHRSSEYDTLLAAESRAQKNGKGLHSKKEVPIHRVADISGDVGKAKQFLPFLQRAKKSEAIVEFVVSGSRLRLFIPRETCLITFLLAGINCPRVARTGPAGVSIEGEPYGNEALQYTRELLLQREVEVEVEAMDKAGNFIGWLFIDGNNHSVSLVEEGLASVHFTAERSQYYKQLVTVEESAKQRKEKIWENFVEQAEPVVEPEKEDAERKINYKKVFITEVLEDLHFYAQHAESGPQLTQLMEQFRAEMTANPPLPGAYKPKKGDLIAAKFSMDSEWYRARIEKVTNSGAVCFYVDYGNRENVSASSLAVLPSQYHMLPPQAHEYALACVMLPNDTDAIQDAREAFAEDTANHQFYINNEYRDGKLEYVSLIRADTDEDVAKSLVEEGLVIAEARREKRLQKLVSQYQKAMESAKSARRNLWRYGDITEDDAKEFGYNV